MDSNYWSRHGETRFGRDLVSAHGSTSWEALIPRGGEKFEFRLPPAVSPCLADARRRWKRSGKSANLKQVLSHAKRNPLPITAGESAPRQPASCRLP